MIRIEGAHVEKESGAASPLTSRQGVVKWMTTGFKEALDGMAERFTADHGDRIHSLAELTSLAENPEEAACRSVPHVVVEQLAGTQRRSNRVARHGRQPGELTAGLTGKRAEPQRNRVFWGFRAEDAHVRQAVADQDSRHHD